MRTRVSDRLDIEYPILAFSHCRDVVAAVTNSGGMGVLGAAFLRPDQLEVELDWIDAHTSGRPYAVDLLFPTMQGSETADRGHLDADEIRTLIPQKHLRFAELLLDEFAVPPMPDGIDSAGAEGGFLQIARNDSIGALEQFDVVFGHHQVRLIACGLGVPPQSLVVRAHDAGRLVASLIGHPSHVARQLNAGVDFLIAQGTEAGGHTGEISTMVLIPQVVALAGAVPVIAAGGIGSGRQIAAAIALGAEAVWCGSLWLTTEEAETAPALKAKLLAASSSDTIRSRSWSGKPMRMLRSAWPEAWERPDAPKPLPPPLQDLIASPAQQRAARVAKAGNGGYELTTGPVGQVIGLIDQVKPVRQVMLDLVTDYADVLERFARQHADLSAE